MWVRFLLTLTRRSVEEYFADNCTQMAAAISYYVLFSLFPLLIFVVGVMGLFLQNTGLQNDVIDAVLSFIPLSEGKGRDQVTEAVRGVAGVGSGALGLFGLVGMAWSGSNMFGIIRRSINTAYDLDYRRPLVQQKLLDLAMVAGMGFFFLVSIGATAFLRVVRDRSQDIPYLGDAAERTGFAWDTTSFLVPMALSFMAFTFLYWIVPATKVRPRDVWLGALVAAFLFEVTKIAFSLYLENFSNYDLVYGSLGAVASFLFWVYLSANILLLGAEVAAEYPRVLRGDYAEARATPARPFRETVVAKLRGLFLRQSEDEEPRPPSGARRPD
jgi:membrane protein